MQQFSVVINNRTQEGKNLLAMLKLLAEKSDAMELIEEVKDEKLIKLIKQGRKSGLADTKSVLKKLRIA